MADRLKFILSQIDELARVMHECDSVTTYGKIQVLINEAKKLVEET